eukprot:4583-Heterococcus_DN1.PRE.3
MSVHVCNWLVRQLTSSWPLSASATRQKENASRRGVRGVTSIADMPHASQYSSYCSMEQVCTHCCSCAVQCYGMAATLVTVHIAAVPHIALARNVHCALQTQTSHLTSNVAALQLALLKRFSSTDVRSASVVTAAATVRCCSVEFLKMEAN